MVLYECTQNKQRVRIAGYTSALSDLLQLLVERPQDRGVPATVHRDHRGRCDQHEMGTGDSTRVVHQVRAFAAATGEEGPDDLALPHHGRDSWSYAGCAHQRSHRLAQCSKTDTANIYRQRPNDPHRILRHLWR